LLGRIVKYDVRPPHGVTEDDWRNATQIGNDARGPIRVIGMLECVLFYVSFWFAAWPVAGGWLVFKLGSKWESWQSITKVPEQPPEGVTVLEYMGAKNRWGSRVLQNWLLGILLNGMAAFLGVVVSIAIYAVAGSR
jgi:hypothetical protein